VSAHKRYLTLEKVTYGTLPVTPVAPCCEDDASDSEIGGSDSDCSCSSGDACTFFDATGEQKKSVIRLDILDFIILLVYYSDNDGSL
jgi:hypothetical protein